MSHRSGETEDVTILIWRSVWARVKLRLARCRGSERIAKYNELLRIAEKRPDLEIAHPFVEINSRKKDFPVIQRKSFYLAIF